MVFAFQIFKEPLEQSGSQRGGALLASEEIKTIFGAIPDLLEVHKKLLVCVWNLLNVPTFYVVIPFLILG